MSIDTTEVPSSGTQPDGGTSPSKQIAHRLRPYGSAAFRLVLTLLGLLTLLFFLVRLSGDPASVIAGQSATPSQVEAVRVSLGLDRPIFIQYFIYLGDVIQLDFGSSLFTKQAALPAVLDKLPATLLLMLSTMTLAIATGIPAGVMLARDNGAARRFIGSGITLAQAIPGFILGVVLIYFFAVKLGWFPAYGSGTPATLVLPTLTLAGLTAARTARMVAAELEHGADDEYLRTAIATGASPRRVLWRHALPNAFPPVAAMLVVEVSYLISGAVVVEVLFAYSGVGKQLVDAIFARDYPLVQATVFVIGVFVIIVNLLGDLLLRRLDPRTTRSRA